MWNTLLTSVKCKFLTQKYIYKYCSTVEPPLMHEHRSEETTSSTEVSTPLSEYQLSPIRSLFHYISTPFCKEESLKYEPEMCETFLIHELVHNIL